MLQLEYLDEKVKKILCNAKVLQKTVGLEMGKKIKLRMNQLETKLDMESLKNCKILNVKGVLDYHGGKNEWIIP